MPSEAMFLDELNMQGFQQAGDQNGSFLHVGRKDDIARYAAVQTDCLLKALCLAR